jgi:hypothetical protein
MIDVGRSQWSHIIFLQVFKASRPGIPLRIYFMIYAGSVEEQVIDYLFICLTIA